VKHPWSTTLLLLFLFVCAQLVGLSLVNLSISAVKSEAGQTVLEHTTTAIGERPQLAGAESFLYLLFGVLVGTMLILLLVKFRKVKLWKAWFLLAVFLAQAVSFGVLLPQWIALILALGFAVWKVYWPNPVVHNLTEIFMYAGIAVLLVPIFDVFWMLLMLLAISIYDMIAVWKTKHMVAMAEFQRSSDVFAGLMLPKQEARKTGLTPPPALKRGAATGSSTTHSAQSSKIQSAASKSSPMSTSKVAHAVLGGGDIAFPLLFTGVVMEWLIKGGPFVIFSGLPFERATGLVIPALSKAGALYLSLIITAFTTIALLLLFYYAKKDRYYPAMPFVSAGCVAGFLGILLLL
jgi:presenilin-like A22 family membrane protease